MKARRRFRRGRPEGEPEDLLVEILDATRASVRTPGAELLADVARLPDGRTSVILPSGRQVTGRASLRSEGRAETWVGARRLAIRLSDPLRELAGDGNSASGGAAEVRAQIPGRVIEVKVGPGDRVSAGTALVILEAMKMQNEIRASPPPGSSRSSAPPGRRSTWGRSSSGSSRTPRSDLPTRFIQIFGQISRKANS